jgi:hypothetical protein
MPPELYGPAGALVALAFVVAAFVHGDIVPGWIYKDERAQRTVAETQAQRNAEALADLAKAVRDRTAHLPQADDGA